MTAREMPVASGDIRTISVPTLFGARTGALQDLTSDVVALTGLYCDHFGGRAPAARYGARQIRYSSTESSLPAPRKPLERFLVDIGDLKVFPLDPVRTKEVVGEQCTRIVETGARLLVLGGDYSLAPAILGGALRARPQASYGLLRLSCDMDLRPLDNERTSSLGRRFTTSRIATMLPRGLGDVALVGVRGLVTAEESDRAAGTLLVTAVQLHGKDTSRILDRLLCWASQFSAIFLSVDADVLAGAASEKTTLPGSAGLRAETIVRILQSMRDVSIPIAHLAGHRPDFDLTGRTATETITAVGLELIEAMLSGYKPCR